ncbi:iron complex outermembrane recepter protein [Marinobacter segnicrescens]|uniref:Iron complex outermembrane recepter protein n=1 Tax=Marinobacter segnicrescens TaxID=430453 RepID=A0A1H9Z9U2_9GAMM|nr:TonB-dependent receptor [Marinobacter segnicrescens]SES78329.1 iron complex outermembrane recepter protein [Marinobacter segnicrescens]
MTIKSRLIIKNDLRAFFLIGAGVVFPGLAIAQQAVPEGQATTATTGQNRPAILVTAPRMSRSLQDTPAAVSAVTRDQIQQGQQGLQLDESLVIVPGLFLQNHNNFAQGQRIASRGFGARAPFGIRGIHVRVDGIPYTLPDGQAQVDAIDLDSAERIEVIRGPASVLYGNAAGGVIDVTTADGSQRRDRADIGLQGGSDGYRKLSASLGGENGRWRHNLSFSALDFEGQREQSEVEKRLFNGQVGYQIDEDRTLSALVNVLDMPLAEDPGGLTLEEVEEDRDQAAPMSDLLDAGQEVEQQLVGLHYQDRNLGGGDLNLRAFASWRDFEQQLPFPGSSRIRYDRFYYGGGADYRRGLQLWDLPTTVMVGTEVGRQEDDRSRFAVNTDREITARTGDEQQDATATGVFALADMDLNDRLTVSAGVRHDWVRLSIDDRFLADGVDNSGSRTFREWNGSLGALYRLSSAHSLYANVATAFETPTFTEFARPDGQGGFNSDVEPQRAISRELGLRGYLSMGIEYDLSVFRIDVDDELLPFEAIDGRTYYQNAGQTSRQGAELALDWYMTPAWRWHSALTMASYRFEDFETETSDFSGLRMPGLPRHQWNNRLTWSGLGDTFASIEGLYSGDFYADNANTVEVDSSWVMNLRAGTGWQLGGDRTLKVHAGIRNLLEEEYYANVRINANGGRYYEPAPGLTFHGGVELAF